MSGKSMSGKSKSRRVLRAKEAIGVKSAKNRSADLLALTDQFNEIKGELKKLVGALKSQHASMQGYAKARAQVAKHISHMTEKSPLADVTGHFSEGGGGDATYSSIHQSVLNRQMLYSDRFLKFVINYAAEWEKVVVTRVSDSIRKAEMLRRDLDHYQGKVEALRKTVNVKMAKGKLVDPKDSEKLKRNEDKLMSSRREYEEFTAGICTLIEEVTDRSWKDCHPLLIKLTQFDATLSAEEAKIFAGLSEVTENLKQIARKHGLKPEARLKDIESQSANMVSTKDRERALEYEKTGALTMGDSFDTGVSPSGADSVGSGAGPLSPQSWAADSVNSLPQNPPPRTSSFSSVGSASMPYGGAAAPPPTLDQLNDATGGLGISDPQSNYSRHAHSTGALPPLPPSSNRNISRSGSLQPDFGPGGVGRSTSDGSNLSCPVAPAPAAPPPPPPSSLSMYAASTETALTPADSSGYSNYQSQAPPPVQTGAPAAHPWSSSPGAHDPFGGSPAADVNPYGGGGVGAPQMNAYGAPSPPSSYGAPPMNQYGAPPPASYGDPNVAAGGAPPMNQYGAPSPPASYGAPMGNNSTHSASTNPFE